VTFNDQPSNDGSGLDQAVFLEVCMFDYWGIILTQEGNGWELGVITLLFREEVKSLKKRKRYLCPSD
jgi:hypothetical protein